MSKIKFVREKYNGVNIGYQAVKNGNVLFTIHQNDYNKTWNIYHEKDVLNGWVTSAVTLKEAKEAIQLSEAYTIEEIN